MRVLVLGGGLVGSAIARDLSRDDRLDITVADLSPQVRSDLADRYGLKTIAVDVTDQAALVRAAQGVDLVIGAVPGFLGYRMLETLIRAGRHVVDISFCPEDPLALQELAVAQHVTVVVDAGVSPGLGNLVLGHYHELYDRIDHFVCYVGGLPQVRKWPFQYQSVFSPIDVIEEYTRPARLRIEGKVVTRPALSDLEQLDLPQVGVVEAFNTDGLRTLLTTLDIPNMREKTVRYPGHAEQMRMLRDTGFFSTGPLDIDGRLVSPLAMTSRLLFDAWQPEGDGRDLVVMRVVLTGQLGGRPVTTTVDLYDEYDASTHTTAMARTTGYTCAAVARLVLDGSYREPGIAPLEMIGANRKAYDRLLDDLGQRGISLTVSQREEA